MTDLEKAIAKIEGGVKELRVMPGYELEAHEIQTIVDGIREDSNNDALDNAKASAA